MAKRCSIARPSNQWRIPPSNVAGPLRTSVPSSQRGSSPSTATSSSATSSSSVSQPFAVVTSVVAVNMANTLPRGRCRLYRPSWTIVNGTVIRLTPTSYVVLGLVRELGEATPYALKQAAALSVGNFWSLQHAQLYSEPERLAKAGLLDEELETTGPRRKT